METVSRKTAQRAASARCRLKCTWGIRWAGVLGFRELLKKKPSSTHADPLWLRGLKHKPRRCACLCAGRCFRDVTNRFNGLIWGCWHAVRRVPVCSLEPVTFLFFPLPGWAEFGLLYFYLCFCQPYNHWLRSGSNRLGEHNTTEWHAWSRACWERAWLWRLSELVF